MCFLTNNKGYTGMRSVKGILLEASEFNSVAFGVQLSLLFKLWTD
ncbi:hypothetical protein [Fuchsiella alkaliacetigena]|nr:hypothetical protein [Fuchsiella alkaliacetigena]